MGVVEGVGFDEFPKQGPMIGARVRVCFSYDTTRTIGGTCVRDDYEEPYETIFRLDDGRFVRSNECMYQSAAEGSVDPAVEGLALVLERVRYINFTGVGGHIAADDRELDAEIEAAISHASEGRREEPHHDEARQRAVRLLTALRIQMPPR